MLLTSGNYLGTLAAARDLGREGIKLTLADAESNTLVSRSCYVQLPLQCPPPSRPAEWLAWMIEHGRRATGQVLFATSDDICWLMEHYREALSRHYVQYSAAPGAMMELLDKHKLYRHCACLDIDQPEQWTAAEALGHPSMRYPVVVKPRTQAGICANPKGIVCANEPQLRAALEMAKVKFVHWPDVLVAHPEFAEPVVQAFHAEAEQHIYSLAGFYAPERDVFLVRAAEKVLQHPMRIGVGLCFESRPVAPALASQLRQLFDRVGYRGPFEVEFIHLQQAQRYLLIDVNPRFYGQMGFELARGLPTARLCYAAATGDTARVDDLAAEAAHHSEAGATACFRDAWLLRLYATTHWLSGNFNLDQWRFWMRMAQRGDAGDPVLAQDDPTPSAHRWKRLALNLTRNPRSTLLRFFVR